MANILDEIVAHKKTEVARAKERVSLADLQAAVTRTDPSRDFHAAVTRPGDCGINLIAEIKRRSPSAGLIREDLDPATIARTYYRAGVSAISVLTDHKYFDGCPAYLEAARQAVPLPVLRKDFILEAYQVYESRAMSADAVLLIAEVLGAEGVTELSKLAGELGMSALIEAHDVGLMQEVLGALGSPLPAHVLIGINNRDLTVQKTDIQTTVRLAALMEDTSALVSESGIKTREDVLTVERAGARAILVGETIMRSADLAEKIRELLGSGDTP